MFYGLYSSVLNHGGRGHRSSSFACLILCFCQALKATYVNGLNLKLLQNVFTSVYKSNSKIRVGNYGIYVV